MQEQMTMKKSPNLFRRSIVGASVSGSLTNSKANRIYRQEIQAEETFVEKLREEVEKHGTATI